MIDIHCHALPGVDDGVVDSASARRFCELASADGVRALIATPHQRHPQYPNTDRSGLERLWRRQREEVADLLDLHLGAEVHLDPGFLAELDRGDSSHILPLAGSRYLLLELPRFEGRPAAEEVLHEVQLSGFRPVLAHPELIPYLVDDLPRLERLVADGVLLQLTAASVTGGSGRRLRQASWELLRRGWVHFVASDGHSPTWRPPGLSEVRRVLGERLGEEVAELLTEANPARVLADEAIAEGPGRL